MDVPTRSYATVEIRLYARSAGALEARILAAGGGIEGAGIDGVRIVRIPACKASVVNLVAQASARESGGRCDMVAADVSVVGFDAPPKPMLRPAVVRHEWRRDCGLTPARFLADAFERASAKAVDWRKEVDRGALGRTVSKP